jgi:Replication-relaxation
VLLLQGRDLHLLGELSLLRIIDREQAKVVAGFHSTTRANARLLALTNAGLLNRYFVGTVAGGKKAIYHLSSRGAKLVQVPRRGPRRRRDEVVTTDFFVEHQLGINEIYCLAKHRPIPLEESAFARWESFAKPIDSAASLIPDGFLVVNGSLASMAAFLEFDLGHENLRIWRAKIQSYLRYALSGEFESRFGLNRFRVLVVTPSETRRDAIRRTVATLTNKIFYFATMPSVRHHGLWAHTWLRANGNEPVSLL